MPRIRENIGNKRNTLGNSFGTSGKRNLGNLLGDHEHEWYNTDYRKPEFGYVLDEDGNYPENWRWF